MKQLAMSVCLFFVLLTSSRLMAAEYTIMPGDTLSGIAVKTGNTVSNLCAANKLRSDSVLIPGKKLAYVSLADLPAALAFWGRKFGEFLNAATSDDQKNKIYALMIEVEPSLYNSLLQGTIPSDIDPDFLINRNYAVEKVKKILKLKI
jgi:hypothetical protein